MLKQCTCLILLIATLALIAAGPAYGGFNPLKDPAIIGWWTCDEGQGDIVADSSPKGNDGKFINGNPMWTTGVYGNAITLVGPTLVEVQPMGLTLSQATMAGWLFAPAAQPSWASFIMHRGPGPASGFNLLNDRQLAYHWSDASNTWSFRGNVLHPLNEWAHCAVTVEPTKATFYLNGVASAVNTVNHPSCAWDGPIWLGGDGGASWVARRMNGASLDDVCFFSRALMDTEIVAIMQGLFDPALAGDPSPENDATDVPQDSILTWKAGETAATHDVYFGTAFDDVNDASRTNPGAVLVSQGQADTLFDPGILELGVTYYWRIDEVEAGGAILKGTTWSFTAEPLSYPVTPAGATASSFQANMGPQNTINGSGLNADDQHSVELTQMWMSAGVKPNWIQYEFDNAYKLDKMLVWNSNQIIEPFIGFGAKSVTIEYSTDGETWATLDGVPEFARGTGTATYAANTTVEFGGVVAKYVKLTINANHGGVAPQTGLAEVRFFQIPVQAFYPDPADGAAGISINTELNWRPGREATSHTVYIGTDEAAVADGTIGGTTVADHSYTPGALDLGATYYWKVDESGDSGAFAGNVWSFTTEAYGVVDDFESYTDDIDAETTIWHTWIDGLTDGKSGSQVGYDIAPFAEKTTIHGGRQAMPLLYNNVGFAFSEATRTFDSAQNWAASGIKTLAVHFYGAEGNTGKLYLKVGSAKIAYNGEAADIARAQWQQWLVDLSAVSGAKSVRTITIGIEGAGASGKLYIDDIALYPNEIELVPPVQPDTTGLVIKYLFDKGSGTTVTDGSGKGNTGTINGTPRWVQGVSGTALEFDGAFNYVSTGKSLLNDLPAFTIACWLKGDLSMANRSGLIGQNDCVEYGVVSANTVQIWTVGGGAVNLTWPYSSTEEWHHIAAVGDGAGIVFYLDGMPAASGGTATASYGTSTFPVNIGGGGVFDATGNFFTGQIDEVYVYQRALTIAEIAGLAGRTAPMAKPL